MDYKWNIYTCDVFYEERKKIIKWFKTQGVNEQITETISWFCDWIPKNYICVITNSDLDAEKQLIKIANDRAKKMANDRFNPRDVYIHNICNLRKVDIPISDLLKKYNSTEVIEYLKERGISTVMTK